MLKFRKTRKGVASLYIVVFTTILFGVITLSFIRIILSENSQSGNDDLSRSAYDSALAGVEDARYMVNKYYECLGTEPATGAIGSSCSAYNIFSNSAVTDCESGFPLADKMGAGTGEVKIQESSENNTEQAYTCVIVKDTVPDYRGTLSTDTRTKVIPLSVNRDGTSTGTSANPNDKLSNVKLVEFSWYSQANQGSNNKESNFSLASDGKFTKDHTIPPTISFTLLRVRGVINPAKINELNNSNEVIYSTMILLPSSDGSDKPSVRLSTIKKAGDAFTPADPTDPNSKESSNMHDPIKVKCSGDSEFACTFSIQNDGVMQDGDNVILIVSLPYGDNYTDFAIRMIDEYDKTINLTGVQISVDSTGRANQLVRRVETRLDAADLYFPYPQYALELTSDDAESLKKKFWVTINCWTHTGYCDNNNNTP